jgi:hypothetical protein
MGTHNGVGVVCVETTAQKIADVASSMPLEVGWVAHSLAEVGALLRSKRPSLILIEFGVDGEALWQFLDDQLHRPSRPGLVVFGRPNRTQVFRLAEVGVDAYFESFDEAQVAVSSLARRSCTEALLLAARRNVGELGLKETLRAIRADMFREALRLTGGNRHAAARMLRVDRRYVLKMVKEVPLLRTA